MRLPIQTRTPTPTCSDCPTPPSGTVDWVVSTFRLAAVPALALLLVLSLFVASRGRLVGARPWMAAVASVAVAGTLAVLALLQPPLVPSLPAADVGVLVAALVVVTVTGWALDVRSPPAALLLAAAVWVGTWTASLPLLDVAVRLDAAPRLLLPALAVLGYPLGASVGHYDRTGDDRWVVVAGTTMVVVVVVTMASYVPLPGGPAVLVVPIVAVTVVVLLAVATPLVALGATCAATEPATAGQP